MKYEPINTQNQLDELLVKFDWPHAFIREMYTISPSYIDPKEQNEQCWGWQVRYGKYYHFDELGLPFEDLD